MVVDDSVLLQEWMKREVGKIDKDIRVKEAFDCAEAKQVFSDFRPDAVILDISLPDGSGISLIPHFRKNAPDTRIIMLSNLYEKMIIKKCMDNGADSFFDKSDLRSFLEYVRREFSGVGYCE